MTVELSKFSRADGRRECYLPTGDPARASITSSLSLTVELLRSSSVFSRADKTWVNFSYKAFCSESILCFRAYNSWDLAFFSRILASIRVWPSTNSDRRDCSRSNDSRVNNMFENWPFRSVITTLLASGIEEATDKTDRAPRKESLLTAAVRRSPCRTPQQKSLAATTSVEGALVPKGYWMHHLRNRTRAWHRRFRPNRLAEIETRSSIPVLRLDYW